MEIQGYEYNIQFQYPETSKYYNEEEWHYTSSNRFSKDIWYPTAGSARNALSQMKFRSWYAYQGVTEYRIVKRPFGVAEVVE